MAAEYPSLPRKCFQSEKVGHIEWNSLFYSRKDMGLNVARHIQQIAYLQVFQKVSKLYSENLQDSSFSLKYYHLP